MSRSRLLSLIGVALLLVVGLALGIGRSERWSHDELERTFEQRATLAAQVISATLDQTLRQTREADRQTFDTPTISSATIRAAQGDRRMPKLVLDRRGRVLAAWPRALASGGARLARTAPIRAVLSGRRETAVVTSAAGVTFAVAFESAYGRRVSVGPVPPPVISGFLADYLRRVRTDPRDGAFVVDGSGRLLSTALRTGEVAPARAPTTEHFTRDGVSMFAARTRFAEPADDWQLVLTTPDATLYEATSGLRERLPWILLGGVALLAAAVLWLVRRVARDATAMEDANAQLARRNDEVVAADRLKGEFLATMSHELRTPLNGIIGFAELMHDGHVGAVSEEHREYLGDILTSSAHLRRLIDDILDLSKIEAGKMDLRPTRIDAAAVVEEVCGVVGALAAERRIDLTTAVDPGLGPLHLDGDRLRQVLLNYVSNALKFTPEDGHVVIRARREPGDRVRFTVEDDGPGVDPADADRLWHAFEQLETGSARRYGGTGLGLSLTRRLAEAQSGTVAVDERPGGGARFHIVLPVGTVPETPAPGPAVLAG